jgi:hypothetical protein
MKRFLAFLFSFFVSAWAASFASTPFGSLLFLQICFLSSMFRSFVCRADCHPSVLNPSGLKSGTTYSLPASSFSISFFIKIFIADDSATFPIVAQTDSSLSTTPPGPLFSLHSSLVLCSFSFVSSLDSVAKGFYLGIYKGLFFQVSTRASTGLHSCFSSSSPSFNLIPCLRRPSSVAEPIWLVPIKARMANRWAHIAFTYESVSRCVFFFFSFVVSAFGFQCFFCLSFFIPFSFLDSARVLYQDAISIGSGNAGEAWTSSATTLRFAFGSIFRNPLPLRPSFLITLVCFVVYFFSFRFAMAEFKAFSTDLTSLQVTDLYQGNTIAPSPVLHLSFHFANSTKTALSATAAANYSTIDLASGDMYVSLLSLSFRSCVSSATRTSPLSSYHSFSIFYICFLSKILE